MCFLPEENCNLRWSILSDVGQWSAQDSSSFHISPLLRIDKSLVCQTRHICLFALLRDICLIHFQCSPYLAASDTTAPVSDIFQDSSIAHCCTASDFSCWCDDRLVFGVMRKITSAAAKALIQIWVAASIDGEMMSRRCDGKAGELKVLRVMIKVRWRWWRTMRATVSQATGAWCFIVIRHWSLSYICSWGDQFKPGDSAIKITLIFHHRDGNDRLWL